MQISVGQTLAATVLKVSNGQALLNVAGQTFAAKTSPEMPLIEGQQLQAKVTQIKPNVVLTFSNNQNQPAQVSSDKILQQVLTQILPDQTSVSQGLTQLVQLTQTGGLPTIIQTYLFKLFDGLFKLSDKVKVEEFKAALLSSGLFLENSLAKNKKPYSNDFKAHLLKLLDIIRNEPTQSPELKSLAKTLHQLLNKVTHQQIQAIENPNAWNIQLPTSPNNLPLIEFQLDIRKTTGQQDGIWETIISLDISDMGTMVAKCIMQNEEFGFQFWTEQTELGQRIEDNLSGFREQLRQNGLRVKHILMNAQKPEVNPMATKIALIDIRV
ncbi:hypothetical protein HVMH_0858 [Hydrogenovibrio marinus]|nr:hypothetical protein HVMH_0858 [Hydrogenovibrio marinus]